MSRMRDLDIVDKIYMNNDDLHETSKRIRKKILRMTLYSKSSHIGAAFSIVEILVVLYFKIMKIYPQSPEDKNRDKFILSKAHGSAALYSVLVERGFFDENLLERYYVDNGILPGHLDKDSVPGIEVSAGSLGHGLSIGVGMAISNMRYKNPGRIFVLVGDGECNEGSIWEAVMLASHLKLNNLTAIVDYNKIQSFGRTNEVINQEPIVDRWKSFGWEVFEINGHDYNQLIEAFEKPHSGPRVIIANTVKGKGVSFMEDKLEWHYKSPNAAEYELAIKEIENHT